MNYRLRTLHLGTDFDRPVQAMPVPGVARRGDTPSLVILDGASRAPVRLSRLVRPAALLGLQIEKPSETVLLRVSVLVNDLSTDMWLAAHPGTSLSHEHRRHRLLRLSVQGRARGTLVLDRRPGDGEDSVQWFSVALRPEEFGAGGLLTLAVDVPDVVPAPLRPGLLEDGPVGVCIGRVTVEPLGGRQVRPSLSTGRVPVDRRHLVPRSPGALVVNPGGGDLPLEVRLMPRERMGRPRPAGVRAWAREPLARGRDGVRRTVRALTRAPLEVQVVPVDGGPVLSRRVVQEPDGGYLVPVPRDAVPAYVHAVSTRARPDWYAWVREVESE